MRASWGPTSCSNSSRGNLLAAPRVEGDNTSVGLADGGPYANNISLPITHHNCEATRTPVGTTRIDGL